MNYSVMESSPFRIEKRASRLFGVAELLLGIVIVGPLLGVFFSGYSARGFQSSSIYLALTMPGWAFVIGGWYLIVSWKLVEIDNDTVRVVTKGIWNRTEWREPLNNYLGVEIASKPRFKPDNLPMPGRVYTISLMHSDTKKTIPLYQEVSLYSAVERWRKAGELLELPQLETPDVKQEREAYLS